MKKRESHKYQGVGLKIKMLYMKRIVFSGNSKKIKSKCWIFRCVAPLWTKSFQTELTSMQRKGALLFLPVLSFLQLSHLSVWFSNVQILRKSNAQRYIFCVCANVEILHLLQLQIKSQPIVWASYSAFPPIYTLPNSFAPAKDVLFTDPLDSEPVFVF